MHNLRASPCVGNSPLTEFDSLQRKGFCMITHSNLSNIQWLQARLPVKDCGLGVRRVALLASSAFLASAASSLALQDLILSRCNSGPDAAVSRIRSLWCSTHNLPEPCKQHASVQKAWDKPF